MFKSKKKFLYLAFFCLFILLLFLSVKTFYYFSIPREKISNSITEVFRENFDKAIKFDSLSIDILGDIVLNNFNLSNSADFNDDISLIKAREFIIQTSLGDLLKGEFKITGFSAVNSRLNLVKPYGISYGQMIKNLLYHKGKSQKEFSRFFKGPVKLEFKNAEVNYLEFFKHKKATLSLQSVNFAIFFKKRNVKFTFQGEILKRNKNFQDGTVQIRGILTENSLSELSLSLNHFGVSTANVFVSESNFPGILFDGNITGTLLVKKVKHGYSMTMNFGLKNFFMSSEAEGLQRGVILDDNIKIASQGVWEPRSQRLELTKLTLSNGILDIDSKFRWLFNRELSVKFKTGKTDLGKLSKKFKPVSEISYGGMLEISGKLGYNIAKSRPEDLGLLVKGHGLSCLFGRNGNFREFKNSSIDLSLNNEKLKLKGEIKYNDSDLNIVMDSDIKKLFPLKSNTEISMESGNLDICDTGPLVSAMISGIYSKAYVDMHRGYSQMYFLKEPEGVFFNNNNFTIKGKVDKLNYDKQAFLHNLGLSIHLKNGLLRTGDFSLEGLGGKYSFNLAANLNQDYPYINLEGKGSGIKLATGDKVSSVAGTLEFLFSYHANFYRIGHILENGKGDFAFSLRNGSLEETGIQNTVFEFLSRNEYDCGYIKKLNPDYLGVTLRQAGHNCYIKNFSLRSKDVSFSTSGKYRFSGGMNLRLPLLLTSLSTGKKYKIPLRLKGLLLKPCLSFESKKRKDRVCF